MYNPFEMSIIFASFQTFTFTTTELKPCHLDTQEQIYANSCQHCISTYKTKTFMNIAAHVFTLWKHSYMLAGNNAANLAR